MSEIALRPDYAPSLQPDPTGGRLVAWAQAAAAANQLARALVRTTFVPQHFKGNEGDATAAIMAGDEVGLSPIASLRSFYVVHGTPALYAKAMVALVQSQGHEVWTEASSDSQVVVCGQRRGSNKIERADWTISRAQKAGYTTNKKYSTNPQEMLWSKGASEVCRKVAADVLTGIPFSVEDLELEQQPMTTVEAKPARKATVSRVKPDLALAPEPTFDEPAAVEPEPETPGDRISAPQMKMLHALFNEKGFKDRDDGLDYIATIVGAQLESSKDLTKDEASKVIDALTALDPA
jgi:hypothetical protein